MPPRKTKASAAASTPAAEKPTRSSRSKKASADDVPSTSAPPSDETAAALEPSMAEKAVGALVDGVGKAVNAVKHLGESVEALGEDVVDHAAKAFDQMESAEVPTAAKVAHEVEVVAHAVAEGAAQTKDSGNKGKGKGKGKAQEVVQEEKEEPVGPPVAAGEKKGTTTMEERQAKLKELRLKMVSFLCGITTARVWCSRSSSDPRSPHVSFFASPIFRARLRLRTARTSSRSTRNSRPRQRSLRRSRKRNGSPRCSASRRTPRSPASTSSAIRTGSGALRTTRSGRLNSPRRRRARTSASSVSPCVALDGMDASGRIC